jgi:hypothetical protein
MTDQDMLTAAQTALHKLLTGTQAVEVEIGTGQGAYRTKFSPAKINDLKAYIQTLEDRIANRCTRGAIGIVF